MKGLSSRQREVLSYIEEYIATHKFSPSYREIQNHFGFASIGSVSKHVNVLIRKGALTSEKQCGRSLTPVQPASQKHSSTEIELPYIGYISANNPIETFPQSQTLAIPEYLVRNPELTYVLRARGNSLKDELISDGDLIVIETRTEAFDGETIIASMPGRKTVIKKYHPEGNYVRLDSQSEEGEPLIVRNEELTIHAVLLSLLRLYS